MQIFWTGSAGGLSESRSVYQTYTLANDSWAELYFNVGANPGWSGQQITQLRLDFDNTSKGNRWLIDYIVFEP